MEALALPYLRHFPPHRGRHSVVRTLQRWVKPRTGERIERRDGLQWSLNLADFASRELYWYGCVDQWEIHHLLRQAPSAPRMCVFFDIGANMGYYSLKLAKEIGPRFEAHAFEPFPATFERLERNISLNGYRGNINAHRVGLSDVAGVAGFDVTPKNSGAVSLTEAAAGVDTTPTITLDEFCEREGMLPDLVKVDVEGFEARVLRGGRKALSEYRPPMVMEFMPPNLRAKGSSPEEVRDLLESFGYRLLEIDRDRLAPLARLPQGDEVTNVLCVA